MYRMVISVLSHYFHRGRGVEVVQRAVSFSYMYVFPGMDASGDICFCAFYRLRHIISQCQKSSDGRRQGTACSMCIWIIYSFSFKPFLLRLSAIHHTSCLPLGVLLSAKRLRSPILITPVRRSSSFPHCPCGVLSILPPHSDWV